MPTTTFLSTPIWFLLLFVVSLLVRFQFKQKEYSVTAAGGIVMALGIVVLALIPHSARMVKMLPVISLELVVIWGFIATSYLMSFLQDKFSIHIDGSLNSFAIGTWVAATAIVVLLLMQALPSWYLLAEVGTLLACVLWLWYLSVIVKGLFKFITSKNWEKIDGTILLSTVSTQSIVILINAVFKNEISKSVTIGLFITGFALYFPCLALICRSYITDIYRDKKHRWSHTNCIIHGAASITGLSGILLKIISPGFTTGVWIWAIGAFILIEGISLGRVLIRCMTLGLRNGILIYDVSQWARIFTYGMLYSFTSSMTNNHIFANGLSDIIIMFGPYVLLLLLFMEIGLFIREKFRQPTKGILQS